MTVSAARSVGTGSSMPRIGVGIAVLAAALLACGAVMPVVAGAEPGFTSAPPLIVLAAVPVVAAAVLLVRGHAAAAAGVLSGLAALAPGRVFLALQFAADASVTSRPALYAPEQLDVPDPAGGLWFLVAGQAALILAGVLAVRGAHTVNEASPVSVQSPDARPEGRRLLVVAVCAGVLAAVGLLMAPFTSTDAYLPAQGAFDSSGLVLPATLLLAAALPLAAALAMSSGVTSFARGLLAGLGLGVLAVSTPDLLAAVSMPALGLSAGPLVAIAGAAGLLTVACVRWAEPAGTPERAGDEAPSAGVPSRRRLEICTGTAGLLTCAAALAGAVAAQVTVTGAMAAPENPTRWSLLAAGVLTGALGGGLFVRGLAPVLRPALSVAWVAVLVAGTSVLGAGIAASESGGIVAPGPGVLWTVLAMFLATVTACFSAVAGMVEREDSPRSSVGAKPAVLVAAGGVLAVPGFALPVVSSPGYAGAGLIDNLATASWGLLAGLIAVVGAAALAAYSRAIRAAALLSGAVAVLCLQLAKWPFTAVRLGGLEPTWSWWCALASAVLLALAAGVLALSARGGTRP